MNYLSVENLSKNFGEKKLFENISFGIDQGQSVALVAKNGAGKSTLMRILAGKETPDSGKVVFHNDIRIGFLEQNSEFEPGQSILEVVLKGTDPASVALRNYEMALANHVGEEELQAAMDAMTLENAWDHESDVTQILGKLNLHDPLQKVETLSGGQQKRLALAQVLLGRPEFLILDEPTNHLDLDMIEWLEGYLSASHITLLMVTHDRYFLERVCTEILELEGGILYRHKGSYSYFLEKKDERETAMQSTIDKAKNLFRKELDWMRRQPKARSTKAKSRIDAFYETKEIASKKLVKDEIELSVNMSRIGGKIIEFHHVCKNFGDKIILDDFNYIFKRGEKIGIVGSNGVGKTTFLKMITEEEPVSKGKISVGETIVFGYYTQDGMKMADDKRVIEVIKEIGEFIPMAGGKKLYAIQLLERFMFPSHMHYQYVSKLSGGEKRRLYLLTILMKNPNFLILDEPTNDLDIFTLSALEDYLESFEGCVLVVTHDRYFMDRLADHIFVFEGKGKVKDIFGNYTAYREAVNSKQISVSNNDEGDNEAVKAENASKPTVQPVTQTTIAEPEKKKLTFKEKFEYETLDKEIPLLEKKKAKLEADLASGNLSVEEINKTSEELGKIIAQLDEKSLRWLELGERI